MRRNFHEKELEFDLKSRRKWGWKWAEIETGMEMKETIPADLRYSPTHDIVSQPRPLMSPNVI